MITARLLVVALLVSAPVTGAAERPAYPGELLFENRFSMFVDGRNRIVVPKEEGEGRPWVWRARFWGHEPQFDLAMLEKGYHIVYCHVAGELGNPAAVQRWNEHYAFLAAGDAKGFPRVDVGVEVWRIPSKKWRDLIKKVWEADPLISPDCQREMRIVSLIDERDVIPGRLRADALRRHGQARKC